MYICKHYGLSMGSQSTGTMIPRYLMTQFAIIRSEGLTKVTVEHMEIPQNANSYTDYIACKYHSIKTQLNLTVETCLLKGRQKLNKTSQ